MRYEDDGSHDASFVGPGGGGPGTALLSINGTFSAFSAILLAVDGAMTASGICDGGSGQLAACAARLLPNGDLDPSFDGPSGAGNGQFFDPVTATQDAMIGSAIGVDGRLFLAGMCDGPSNLDACLIRYAPGGTISDYVTGGGSDRDFASGTSTSFFAACLRTVSGGASATWTTAGGCPASDGADWRAVSTTPDEVAYTTALEPDPPDATALLRFAMRAAMDQAPGAYVAPITFDVVAP